MCVCVKQVKKTMFVLVALCTCDVKFAYWSVQQLLGSDCLYTGTASPVSPEIIVMVSWT